MDNINYDIYMITHNESAVYVGMTSVGKHRWVCHKTKARNPNMHSRPIHEFMRNNTEDSTTFPEFDWTVICSTTDEDVAKELEQYWQKRLDVPTNAQLSTRPLWMNDKIERRDQ